MGLLSNFNISGSAVSAQSSRLNTTASNLANAETVASSEELAYRARQPVFKAFMADATKAGEVGVQMLGIFESDAGIARRFEPGHSQADDQGYIYVSNVNPVEEMANMLSASRSYQNNIEVMSTSRDLLLRTLSLGN
ncbi:MAG: flagellar basal-body rod protein FlgC [Gammaproteobacteria bacterium]|jgi:flagellar basal-body rod protein FlgC